VTPLAHSEDSGYAYARDVNLFDSLTSTLYDIADYKLFTVTFS